MEFLHPDAGHVKIEDMAAITDTAASCSAPRDGLQLSSP